jgi:hypothetical protein
MIMPSPEGSKRYNLYYNKHEPKPKMNAFQMKLIIDRMPEYLALLSDSAIKKMEDEIAKDSLFDKAYQTWGEYIAVFTEDMIDWMLNLRGYGISNYNFTLREFKRVVKKL